MAAVQALAVEHQALAAQLHALDAALAQFQDQRQRAARGVQALQAEIQLLAVELQTQYGRARELRAIIAAR